MSDTFGTGDGVQQVEPQNIPPPAEVAGVEAIAAEQEAVESDGPLTLDIRGRSFQLRKSLPGMVIAQMGRSQSELSKLVKRAQGQALDSLPPRLVMDFNRALGDVTQIMCQIISTDDRADFIDWCMECEPPIDSEELNKKLNEGISLIAGRPTSPSAS